LGLKKNSLATLLLYGLAMPSRGSQIFVFSRIPGDIVNRVTRLGEFSFIGQLFILGCVLKIKEVAQIFGPLFSAVPVMHT
jgi:hypothetical protein